MAVRDAILVINAGSSSIKFSTFSARAGNLRRVLGGHIEGLGSAPRFVVVDAQRCVIAEYAWPAGAALNHDDAMAYLLEALPQWLEGCRVRAIGHRVVHGGADFSAPVRIDADLLRRLEELIPLAPLHQPHNLAPIRTLLSQAPALAQVACFDTAFHHTLPAVARAFALPRHITERGVRRYGFHGLSYEYIASVMMQQDRALTGRTVVLHLGNGASMCAMRAGESVATSMGFTALDGLPMGTRCGSLDPGVVLYLLTELEMDADQVQTLLYEHSGLLGVSGISGDMRELEASDDPAASRAIDLYVYRIAEELGALTVALGGLDAIVFTAGIGENSARIRELVCASAACLGIEIDVEANRRHAPRITTTESRVGAWVIATDEEMIIARHTWAEVFGNAESARGK